MTSRKWFRRAGRRVLVDLSKTYAALADLELDEHGRITFKSKVGNDLGLEDTIVVDRGAAAPRRNPGKFELR